MEDIKIAKKLMALGRLEYLENKLKEYDDPFVEELIQKQISLAKYQIKLLNEQINATLS